MPANALSTLASPEFRAIVLPGKATQDYTMGAIIKRGDGGQVVVREGVHKKTGDAVAIKFVNRMNAHFDGDAVARECLTLSSMGTHPNVIEFRGVYVTDKTVEIVLEKAHGDLLSYISMRLGALCSSDDSDQMNPFTDAEAAALMVQVVQSVAHCHGNGIMHRDLKPENILVMEPVTARPQQNPRLPLFAACTLNATGQYRVNLSLR